MAHGEFPFEPARDLVGILRVLYADEIGKKEPNRKKLALIKRIANDLKQAVRLAAGHDPGTAPVIKAIVLADAATKRIEGIYVDIFGISEIQDRIVQVAARRVRGQWRKYEKTEREIKWAVGKLRQ